MHAAEVKPRSAFSLSVGMRLQQQSRETENTRTFLLVLTSDLGAINFDLYT
jgi:hypothetical protein